MFHKVKEVFPLPSYGLLVGFVTGERKLYNVKPLFEKWDAFKALSSINGLFEQVKVDAGGYGVSWNDDIDLSCNELWENGTDIPEEIPNAETVEALRELESGGGTLYTGSVENIFAALEKEIADEETDNAFCERMWENYENDPDPDKDKGVPLEELKKAWGLD